MAIDNNWLVIGEVDIINMTSFSYFDDDHADNNGDRNQIYEVDFCDHGCFY